MWSSSCELCRSILKFLMTISSCCIQCRVMFQCLHSQDSSLQLLISFLQLAVSRLQHLPKLFHIGLVPECLQSPIKGFSLPCEVTFVGSESCFCFLHLHRSAGRS